MGTSGVVCAVDDSEDGPGRRWGQCPDQAHEQALLRALVQINERTWRELGPLTAGGLPTVAKCKPVVPRPVVLTTIPASTSFEEDTTMQWTTVAAVAALATGSALTACGAEGVTARVEPAAVADMPTAAPGVSMPAVAAAPHIAEAADPIPSSDEDAPKPVRVPAIPAAQLRRQILALAGSFQRLEDLERENIEHAFGVRIPKNSNAKEGFYFYKAETTDGWIYWVDISRLYGKEKPSTTYIYLDNGAEAEADPPVHCTLEFEPLAKKLVAMGYEQADGPYRFRSDSTWWFKKPSQPKGASVTIGIGLYSLSVDGAQQRTCIQSFRIGGNVADE